MKYNWRTRLTWIHFMIYNNWQNHKSVHNFECGKDETVKWMLDRCERQKTKKPWDNQTRQHEDKNEKQVTWLKRQYYMFMTVVKKWLRLRFLMGPISFSAFINNPKLNGVILFLSWCLFSFFSSIHLRSFWDNRLAVHVTLPSPSEIESAYSIIWLGAMHSLCWLNQRVPNEIWNYEIRLGSKIDYSTWKWHLSQMTVVLVIARKIESIFLIQTRLFT